MTSNPRNLRIADYSYELPEARIARFPLSQRDASKLLVYQDGHIQEDVFRHFSAHLPASSLLVLNDTKVVHARLLFQKPTGGIIEIFCLEPAPQYADITTALAQHGEVLWQCLVGGAARWPEGIPLKLIHGNIVLEASLVSRNKNDFSIHFRWSPAQLSWAEVLEQGGQVPLPPYLRREAELSDEHNYQTLFAEYEGSVAAPTASLHFTSEVLTDLSAHGVQTARVTLHVGAGTFMPVKAELTGGHEMHHEWIEVSDATLAQLAAAEKQPLLAAGTTGLRTLESLYWLGCKAAKHPDIAPAALRLSQWEAYEGHLRLSKSDALDALREWLQKQGRNKLVTRTGLLIAPGYSFQMADGLLTNFHQPRSTLLLLVAAFIGDDWQRVYDYALTHDFRFLSYGDASLLWRKGFQR